MQERVKLHSFSEFAHALNKYLNVSFLHGTLILRTVSKSEPMICLLWEASHKGLLYLVYNIKLTKEWIVDGQTTSTSKILMQKSLYQTDLWQRE